MHNSALTAPGLPTPDSEPACPSTLQHLPGNQRPDAPERLINGSQHHRNRPLCHPSSGSDQYRVVEFSWGGGKRRGHVPRHSTAPVESRGSCQSLPHSLPNDLCGSGTGVAWARRRSGVQPRIVPGVPIGRLTRESVARRRLDQLQGGRPTRAFAVESWAETTGASTR